MFDMAFRGALRNHQPGGDRLVGPSLGDEVGDLAFSLGQLPVRKCCRPGDFGSP
jgi:hypothetical protein